MHISAYRLARGICVALVGFVLVEACASNDEASPLGSAAGRGGAGGAEGGSQQVMPDVSTPSMTGGNGGLDPLCGIVDCVPDDARACPGGSASSEVLPLAIGVGGGDGSGGAGGVGGESGSAGADGGPGAGGSTSLAGAGGGWPSAGAAGDGNGTPAFGCRVIRQGTGNRESSRALCAVSGQGHANDPCFSGSDCGPALACVTDGSVARCRPYCCEGESACDQHPGTYCGDLRLEDDSVGASSAPVLVPVCTPADNCDLSEPYPCTAGRTCQCAPGTACVVARPDGTTTCGRPGSGKVDEPCPCDAGLVCSQSAGTCLKLCQPTENREECGDGRCQASAELPAGWGVCIGR